MFQSICNNAIHYGKVSYKYSPVWLMQVFKYGRISFQNSQVSIKKCSSRINNSVEILYLYTNTNIKHVPNFELLFSSLIWLYCRLIFKSRIWFIKVRFCKFLSRQTQILFHLNFWQISFSLKFKHIYRVRRLIKTGLNLVFVYRSVMFCAFQLIVVVKPKPRWSIKGKKISWLLLSFLY